MYRPTTYEEEARDMGRISLRFRKAPLVLFGVTSLLCVGTPLHTRAMPVPNPPARTEDASAREIVEFNQFLEGHPEVAVELHSKPWLVDNYNYLQNHPELKSYLNDHPGLKDEISQNPVAFMREDAQRSELAQFSRFLDTHREIGQQLRSNATLADNHNFLERHPELRTYLQEHTAVEQALHDNAQTFMQEEEGFSRNSDSRDRDMDARNGDVDLDRDADHRNAAHFGEFLDSHREIAEQLRKDPSLADNREFVQNHRALQTFLENNPGVRDDLRRDPNSLMHEEANFDRAENGGYRDPMHDHMADFGGFLIDHRDIARDLNRDPDAVKNQEFVQNRPDLNTYLSTHPDVRNDLMANPQDFVKGAQQMSNGSNNGSGSSNGSGSGSTTGSKNPTGSSETPAPAPKTKQ
jgi:hypothetical protein